MDSHPFARLPKLCWIGVAVLVLASCWSSPVGPADIEASLDLSETELVFGESFRVTLTLTNPTNRDVTLASPMGCLALPSVYRDDERLDWDGTAFLCTAAGTTWVVPAGDAFVAEFELRAALRGGPEPSDYELAPEPGLYELRMENYVGLHTDLKADILVMP